MTPPPRPLPVTHGFPMRRPVAGRRAVLAAVLLSLGLSGVPTAPIAPEVHAACASLQSMIDLAGPGTTITVPACVYHEAVRIRKPLTINAAGVTIDGDNVRDIGVAVLSNDVTINGLTVRNVNAGSHVGAVWSTGVSRFTFRGGAALDSSTVCISLNGGTGHRVLDSEFAGCGKEGYFMNGVSDTLFQGNRVHDNNTAFAFDPGVEAGGGKAMASQRLTFDGNEVFRNGGPGIWFDNGVSQVTATRNRVHDNDRAGIFFEISDGADISKNAVWNNGFGFVAWGYGAGITISSSDRANVHDNTVAWNARGISVISQDRQLSPHTGNTVHDNVVISRATGYVAGWYDDHGGSLFSGVNGNTGYGDRYWIAGAEPSSDRFQWDGGRTSLAAYNATPGEEGATYLTDAARDEVLRLAGIPGIDGTLLGPVPTPTPSTSPPPSPPPSVGPTIGTPLLHLASGQMRSDATLPGRAAWPVAPAAAAYQVQLQRDGGAWTTLRPSSPTARSVSVLFAPASRYRVRVRARDGSGIWGPWSTGASTTVARYQETSAAVRYSGSWTRVRSLGASGAFVRFASRAGATATFSFSGRAVALVAPRGPGRGVASISVDGVTRTRIDLAAPRASARAIVFTTSWPKPGSHRITIRLVGTAGRSRVDVDAFAVIR